MQGSAHALLVHGSVPLLPPRLVAQTVQLLSQGQWLEVLQVSGQVTLQASQPRPAQVGDRLVKAGDTLTTGPRSYSLLQLDSGIGTIQVAENTLLQVRNLEKLRNGARVTTLNLKRGQVRLRIRKLSNPDSRFEIHSPTGIAGVRGTEFGVLLNQSQRMVVGTESGLVNASSNGESVDLGPETGSAIFPAEPPLPPLPLDRELRFQLDEVDYREKQVWISGQVNPLNSVIANGVDLDISKTGTFEQLIPARRGQAIAIAVLNALGDERRYIFLGSERLVQ